MSVRIRKGIPRLPLFVPALFLAMLAIGAAPAAAKIVHPIQGNFNGSATPANQTRRSRLCAPGRE